MLGLLGKAGGGIEGDTEWSKADEVRRLDEVGRAVLQMSLAGGAASASVAAASDVGSRRCSQSWPALS